ncbi:kelch repeat-containing protein, partial [Patescibacteria group bacterium]
LGNGNVLATGGRSTDTPTRHSSSEIFNGSTWALTGNMSTLREYHTSILLNDGEVLACGGHNGSDVTVSCERYDLSDGNWTATGSLGQKRHYHSSTLLNDGRVLVSGGWAGVGTLSSCELYNPLTEAWTNTGNLNKKREDHSTALLPNGKVLAMGGDDNSGVEVNSVELYDPETGTWTTIDSLGQTRDYFSVIQMADGRILVIGGQDLAGTYLSSSEIFSLDQSVNMEDNSGDQRYPDIDTDSEGNAMVVWQSMHGSSGGDGPSGWDIHSQKIFADSGATRFPDESQAAWQNLDDLNTERRQHQSVFLDNGQVLVAGGTNATTARSSSEIYDSSLTWAETNNLVMDRYNFRATKMGDGQVLATGGYDGTNRLSHSEIFNGVDTWTASENMVYAREEHTSTLLDNRNLLIAGGYDGTNVLSHSELWDPANATWTSATNMLLERYQHSAVSLTSSEVLVAGGYDGSNSYSHSELYDPDADTWTATNNMTTSRAHFALELLDNGKVLAVGGHNRTGPPPAEGQSLADRPVVSDISDLGNLASSNLPTPGEDSSSSSPTPGVSQSLASSNLPINSSNNPLEPSPTPEPAPAEDQPVNPLTREPVNSSTREPVNQASTSKVKPEQEPLSLEVEPSEEDIPEAMASRKLLKNLRKLISDFLSKILTVFNIDSVQAKEADIPTPSFKINQPATLSFEAEDLKEQKNFIENIWQSILALIGQEEQKDLNHESLEIRVKSPRGDKVAVNPVVKEEKDGWLEVVLDSDAGLNPGLYQVEVINPETDKTITQNFTWGVLAINPDMAVYKTGDLAMLSIGVLDESGNMVCDAALRLEVKAPGGESVLLSTEDGNIKTSGYCEIKDVFVEPDYSTEYQTTQPGLYEITLTATHEQGSYTITDSFVAEDNPAFTVKRVGPTRVYPFKDQPMELEVTAYQDLRGQLKERLPALFQVKTGLGATVTSQKDYQEIGWTVDLDKGESTTLKYEFDSPDQSPAFYLLGPISIGDWQEPRQWQLAIDANDYMFPFTDIAIGGWSENGGDTTDIYLSINEGVSSPNDSDYIETGLNPSADNYDHETTSTPTDVYQVTQIDFRVRAQRTKAKASTLDIYYCASSGCTPTTQAGATITLTSSWADYTRTASGLTLTQDQINNLRVRISATATGGAAVQVSAADYYLTYTLNELDVTGTVYTDEAKTTEIADTRTVHLYVNGTSKGTDETATGVYEFTGIAGAAADDTVLVYLDDETENGSAATVAVDGSTNISNLDIITDRVIVQHETAGPIDITDLDDVDAVDATDEDGITVTGGTSVSIASGMELLIPSGEEFEPGGSVTTPKLDIKGTYTGAAETLTLSGSGTGACDAAASSTRPLCIDSGTFTTPATTQFTGTTASFIEASKGSNDYDNLTLAPSGGSGPIYTLGTAVSQEVDVDGDLLVGDGTNAVTIQASTYDPGIKVQGSLTLKDDASWTKSDTATITFDGPDLTYTWKDENTVTIQDIGDVVIDGDTNEVTLASDVKAESVNVASGDILDLASSSYALTLTGSGQTSSRPLIVSGTLDDGTDSEVIFTGGSNTDISVDAGSIEFHDLTINNATPTFYSAGDITVAGILIITAGTFDAQDDTITLSGTSNVFTNSGTLTENNSTFKYTGAGTTNILTETYYDLDIHCTGGNTHRFGSSTTTVTNDLDIGNDTDACTADADFNDATLDLNGHLVISNNATFDADDTNPMTLAKNFTNSGTFNANGGRVTLDTTNTSALTYSATTTFAELYCSTGNKTIQFENDDAIQTTVSTKFSIQGTDCDNRITLQSESGASDDWDIEVPAGNPGGHDVDYADISWGDAKVNQIIADNSADLGNNNNMDISADACGITTQGNIYSDEGSTAINCLATGNRTVNVRVNGLGSTTTDCTQADGQWSTTVVASADDVITAYLDEETEEATHVLVSDGTNQTNIHLYQNRVILRDDAGSNITNDLVYDGTNDDSDDDIKVTVDAETNGNMTIDDGFELHIWTSDTFAPGTGTVTTSPASDSTTTDGDIHIDTSAVFTLSGAVSCGGDWTNAGTFTHGSQTVTFTGTDADPDFTITDGGEPFYDVIFNGSGGDFVFADSTIIANDLTMTNGILRGTNDVTVQNSVGSTDGEIILTGGTFTMDDPNNTGSTLNHTPDWTFENLTFGGDSGTETTTSSGTGFVTINGTMTVSANHTLDAGSKTWIIVESGTPLSLSGDNLTENASTFKYTGGDATTITATTYYNLSIHPAAATHSMSASTYTITNDFSIGNGTEVGILDANTAGATVDVNGSMTINNNGTYQADNANSLTIAKDFTNSGTFNDNDGTVVFDTTNPSTLLYGANTTFHDLTSTTGGKTIKFDNAYQTIIEATGTLTLTGASCESTISLDNDDGGATKFILDVQGSDSLNYLKVKNSDASSNPLTVTNSEDQGNNDGWTITDGACTWTVYHASCEIYDPDTATWAATGTLSTARAYHSTVKLTNGKIAAIGGANATDSFSSVEIYDPATATWTEVGNLNTARTYSTAHLVAKNRILVAGGYDGTSYLSSSELFELNDNWVSTGNMNTNRDDPEMVLLNNGQALMAGGFDGTNVLSHSELYDPSTGTWSVANNMTTNRMLFTMNTLNNGQVLVAGGQMTGGGRHVTCELYDPSTGTWALTGSYNTLRRQHQSVLLNDGQVLAAGGNNGSIYHSSSEIFDGSTWAVTGNLNTSRYSYRMVLLNNGQVLAIGGYAGGADVRSSSELFSGNAWTSTGDMNHDRYNHSATLLNNGQVLAAGGLITGGIIRSSSELYDPNTGTWTFTSNMNGGRFDHETILLPNGQVLAVGGDNGSGNLSSAELYDPSVGTWFLTSNLSIITEDHRLELLNNGQVLIAGGDEAGTALSAAQLFIPDGERPVSVDHSNQGAQEHPQIAVTDEDNGIVVWQDDLNNSAPSYFGDSNGDWNNNNRILMQQIESDNGAQQWPEASKPLDIRV